MPESQRQRSLGLMPVDPVAASDISQNNQAHHDSSLVDPLDTSAGVSPTSGMNTGPPSDAIFAWRDRQARKQANKIKDQRESKDAVGFTPPPPFTFSPNTEKKQLGNENAVNEFDSQLNGEHIPTPSIQGILDTIRQRRRSSAASLRSEIWKHDQSALDTASLASEEMHPSNLHPFDDTNNSIPKFNHISPSPVNLPAVIESDHAGNTKPDNISSFATRMQLRGMRRRSSGEGGHEGDFGKAENLGMPTAGGLTASRPHLTALSPLQSFSPLVPPQMEGLSNSARSRTHSRTPSWQSQSGSTSNSALGSSMNSPLLTPSGGLHQLNASAQGLRSPFASSPKSAAWNGEGKEERSQGAEGLTRSRSNASSVTRSLSRRQSFAASRASLTELNAPAERGAGGMALHSHQGGLISKLFIVKAPPKEKAEELSGNRKRTTSNGSTTPYGSYFGSQALMPSSPGPAQMPLTPSASGPAAIPIRGTTRASDIGSVPGPASGGGYVGTPGARTSLLFDPGHFDGTSGPSNIHEQKMLSPEQVVEIAESLRSPVLKGDDDEVFSASLSSSLGGRLSRNSSGRRNHQRSGSGASVNKGSFNKGRFGNDMSFTTPDDEQRGSAPTQAQQEPMELEPMEYVEMNDDVFLPYVDRPTEVAELLALPSNRELVDIISSTFPTSSMADPNDPNGWRRVRPEDWTWQEFRDGHLMISRAECDDFDWIRKARQAIRPRSEAMWQRVGQLLGVDPDMINMGEEYDDVFAPGGALGDVFDSDATTPSMGIASPMLYTMHDDRFGFIGDEHARDQVWVEGLEASGSSPNDASGNDDDSPGLSFGDRKARLSEDGPSSAGLQLSGTVPEMRSASPLPVVPGAMETIGEGEEEGGHGGGRKSAPKLTPAQRAAKEKNEDPFSRMSPPTPASLTSESIMGRSLPTAQKSRSKSFVGLQICTMPSLPTTIPNDYYRRDRDHSGFQQADDNMPHLERGPGNPLFPASFSSLSLAPTLPNNNPALKRATLKGGSSTGQAGQSSGSGSQASTPKMGNGRPPWTELARRKSRGGLSESALTLTSEDDPYF